MTDDLIERLATDAKPVRPGGVPRWLALGLVAGVVLAAVAMIPTIGMRPDMATAWADPTFWVKFAYTLLIALAGFWALERLARPGGSGRRALIGIPALLAAILLLAVIQILTTPPEAVPMLLTGKTALLCPFYIVAFSVPVFVASIIVLRRMAPTNLPLAGLAAGLLSGGTGAWVYAFHCVENGLPFVAIWYTLGIAAVATIGAITARWLLRW